MQGLLSADYLSKASIFGGIGGSNIKSIQRGSVSLSTSQTDITISTVDITKAIIIISNYPQGVGSSLTATFVGAALINSTTLRLYPGSTAAYVEWEVIEFNNVKSLQRGVQSTSNASDTVSITPVNSLKSLLFVSETSTSAVNTVISTLTRRILSNNQIAFDQGVAVNKNRYWQVIEFN